MAYLIIIAGYLLAFGLVAVGAFGFAHGLDGWQHWCASGAVLAVLTTILALIASD